jgi:hypothetical protein
MAWTDDLVTARDNAAKMLAEITASPKPSYAVHGHNFSWMEYQSFLVKTVENINRMLAQGQPFEIVSRG